MRQSMWPSGPEISVKLIIFANSLYLLVSLPPSGIDENKNNAFAFSLSGCNGHFQSGLCLSPIVKPLISLQLPWKQLCVATPPVFILPFSLSPEAQSRTREVVSINFQNKCTNQWFPWTFFKPFTSQLWDTQSKSPDATVGRGPMYRNKTEKVLSSPLN